MLSYIWYKFFRKIGGAAIRNSSIGFDSKIESGSVLLNSTMGRYSFCGYDCFINNAIIGSFVSIADRVSVGRGVHPVDWVSTSPVFYDNRDSVKTKFSRFKREELPQTMIGNDVWIGDNVMVKAGVNIGNGAVVGMGSVVTKDVPPYAIVAGTPAKLIRYRFDNEICERLNESEWWNSDDLLLRRLAEFVKEPDSFLGELELYRNGLLNER